MLELQFLKTLIFPIELYKSYKIEWILAFLLIWNYFLSPLLKKNRFDVNAKSN